MYDLPCHNERNEQVIKNLSRAIRRTVTKPFFTTNVKGIIRIPDDAALIDVLRMITLHFENQSTESATICDSLPADYTQHLMKMITAYEIEVQEIDTVFKLSRDRDAKSYDNIIRELKKPGESGLVIAAEMEKRTKEVFPQ